MNRPSSHTACSPRPRWHPLAWSERAKLAILLAVMFAVWGWVDVRVRGMVDPNDYGLHKTDFTVYTEAGAAFFDGRDPYSVTNPRGWGYLYPPLFAMLVAPLHALPPHWQVLVWFALSALMSWGCYAECVRIARAAMPDEPERGLFGPLPGWVGWTSVAAAALPALNCLQRGQVGVAKVYLLLLGFRLCVENRSLVRTLLGGAVLSLPIVLKITPAVPIGFLLLHWVVASWRSAERSDTLRQAGGCAAGLAGGLVACVLLLPGGLVGWRANLSHLDTWCRTVAVHAEHSTGDEFAGDSYSTRNQSLSNAVRRCGNWASYCFAGGVNDEGLPELGPPGKGLAMDSRLVDQLLFVVRGAAACLLIAVAWRSAGSQDGLELAAGFGLAGVATLIVAPIARGHYFVLLFPAALFLTAWLARLGRMRSAIIFASTCAGLAIAHYVALDMVGRIGLLGIGITIWYTAACVALISWGGETASAVVLPMTVRWEPFSREVRRAA